MYKFFELHLMKQKRVEWILYFKYYFIQLLTIIHLNINSNYGVLERHLKGTFIGLGNGVGMLIIVPFLCC